MNKIITIFIFGIFFLSMASASIEDLGTVQQNDCISLLQTCDDCTYNNITSILYPNRTTEALSLDVEMIQDGLDYSYTFCNTSALGEYLVNGKGDASGQSTWNYKFTVTTTGGDTAIIIPIFLLLVTGGLFVLGVSLKNPVFGFFSGCLGIIAGM